MSKTDFNSLEIFLPAGMADYFDLVGFEETERTIKLVLEERNIFPEGHVEEDYENKDFLPPKGVQDFPIRGKEVLLELSIRRWRHKKSGATLKRDWKIVMDGGLVTQEFADFLKGID